MKSLEEMMFNEGVDYDYVISENDKNSVHIKLLNGDFKDTVYKYGKVGFKEETGEMVYLQFNFDVLESPIKKVEKDPKFKNHIGDLLTHLITNNLDTNEGSYYDENRTDDIEKSDLQ